MLRPDKETTKTRIVFKAAAKFEEMSLNDQIYQGPKLQRELFDVLLSLRRLPIAIVCDIECIFELALLIVINRITGFSGGRWIRVTVQMCMNLIESSLT